MLDCVGQQLADREVGGSPQINSKAAADQLLSALLRWVQRGAAPGTFSFPLAQPAGSFRAIRVHPLNPLSPPPGGAHGLNTRYHWIGRFRPGGELWCRTSGTRLVCTHHRPTATAA